jgi:hypothetical protein
MSCPPPASCLLFLQNIPFFHMYRKKVKVASFAAGVSKLWLIK